MYAECAPRDGVHFICECALNLAVYHQVAPSLACAPAREHCNIVRTTRINYKVYRGANILGFCCFWLPFSGNKTRSSRSHVAVKRVNRKMNEEHDRQKNT